MIKGLVISRAYAQADSPGGQTERTLLNNINARKYEFIIYSSDKGGEIVNDSNNLRIIHEKGWIQYAAALIRRILPDITWLPGYEWYAWDKSVLRHIHKEVDFSKIDYIFTFSYPCSDHWAGLQLKEEKNKFWIAQFYDPWVENPYRRFKTSYFKKKDFANERRVAEKADLIIHNSQAMVDSWLARYGDLVRDKMLVLPMPISFPENFKNIERKQKPYGKIIMSHIGSLMPGRTSECFIEAVHELMTKRIDLRNKVIFNYVGNVTPNEVELIKSLGLTDIFNIVGRVSEDECLHYYLQSDSFLAIDGENICNLFYPSKILKYFYFGKPILGITSNDSVLSSELKAAGHFSYKHSDRDGIKAYILKMITDYFSLTNVDIYYWMKFEPKYVANRYESVFNKITTKICVDNECIID